MSQEGNGQPLVYQVRLAQQNATHLKQLYLQFAQVGKGQEFLESLKQIYQRLRQEPLEFGEPLYRLPALKLLVCHAVLSNLVVTYAVHEEQPLVFIREVKALS